MQHRLLALSAALLIALGTCVTVVDSHVVIAEFKPHKYATDMETTLVKNLEDALKIAIVAKSMGGSVLVLPEWMFISSSYLFFPNAWSKVWAGIKQRYRIGKAVKVGVLRFKDLKSVDWRNICKDLKDGKRKWELKYLRCIAEIAQIDLLAMSFTEHDKVAGQVQAPARTQIYNSLLYMKKDSDLILVYDKIHLINHEAPWLLFGAPLENITGKDLQAFGPGADAAHANDGGLKFGNVLNIRLNDNSILRAGLLICYDIMFPDTIQLLIRQDPTVKTFLVSTQWGNLNALLAIGIQQGASRAFRVNVLAANINTDAEAPDRETGSGWYVKGLPALHTMGNLDETVLAARMKAVPHVDPDPIPHDNKANEDDQEGVPTVPNNPQLNGILYSQYQLGSKNYAILYSTQADKDAAEGRAMLMTLQEPDKWAAKKDKEIHERFFNDDNMLDDLASLDEHYSTVAGTKKGASLSLNETYILTDAAKCAKYQARLKKHPTRTVHNIHCLTPEAALNQTLSLPGLTCHFVAHAKTVGENDFFVAQAVINAKRTHDPNKPDLGDRYARACLFFAIRPPDDNKCSMRKLRDAPRGRDMSYLVHVKTRWAVVSMEGNVRGKNIATVPLTTVLKRYRAKSSGSSSSSSSSSGSRPSIQRVVPLTSRTGCTSSWKKVAGSPFGKGTTILSIRGGSTGCGVSATGLYGTGNEPAAIKGAEALVSARVAGLKATGAAALFGETEASSKDAADEPPNHAVDFTSKIMNAQLMEALFTGDEERAQRVMSDSSDPLSSYIDDASEDPAQSNCESDTEGAPSDNALTPPAAPSKVNKKMLFI